MCDTIETSCSEASLDGWDGPGSLAVSEATARAATEFLRLLPERVKGAEICADPAGLLVFEWRRGEHIVVVSVSASFVFYAEIFGATRVHATIPFEGVIPEIILDGLNRVVNPPEKICSSL